MILRSVVLGSLSVLACLTPALAQAVPKSMPAVAANEQFVYVLHGKELIQLDAKTLEPLRSLSLGEAMAVLQSKRDRVVQVEMQKREVAAKLERAEKMPPAVMPNPAVLKLGLDWLAKHQDKDGRFDADDHDGSATYDVGVTGLALLAFLGEGSRIDRGNYKEQVKRAVQWLVKQQGDNGLIGTNASHDYIYGHAIATFALVEAYGLSGHAPIKGAAQKAINYLEYHRNPYSVWRYQPRDNDNDTSVTAWALHAYASAKDHDLEVNGQALKLGTVWFDEVTDAKGRVGYTKAGERSSRKPGNHMTRFPPDKGEALTAAGLATRFTLGQIPEQVDVMNRGADLIAAKPPVWDLESGGIDPYYWMWGTRAMFQFGGDRWQMWLRHMVPAVEQGQARLGDEAGSWDPVGVWDGSGGRVYSTAMYVMALQVAENFAKVIK